MAKTKNAVSYLAWIHPGNLGDEPIYKIDQAIFTKYGLELLHTKPSSARVLPTRSGITDLS